jgi:hypothetical protein
MVRYLTITAIKPLLKMKHAIIEHLRCAFPYFNHLHVCVPRTGRPRGEEANERTREFHVEAINKFI